MRIRPLILFILVFAGFQATAQQYYYWIQFKDKNQSSFTLSHPTQFLSQKAIDRRAKQMIPITENDLPVSPAYVDSIRPYITQLVHSLKWFNVVVVKSDIPYFVEYVSGFSFVDSVAPIWLPPSRSQLDKGKIESVEPVNQSSPDSGYYGYAFNQIKMLNGDLLHQAGFRGQGITIAMMDNGCNRVDSIAGFDSVRSRIKLTWNFVEDHPDVYRNGAHGTNTFSCISANIPGRIVGTAPDADFFLFTTEDDNDEWIMEEYHWAAAAEAADSAGADILSTSLGYTTFRNDTGNHTYADLNGDYTVITRAANLAFSKGMLVCNSAGNYGGGSWYYVGAPADGKEVLAVGAVNPDENITSFSSRGPNSSGQIKPDVCAQGSGAAVLSMSGNLGFASGTSFSCPILAGCAASLWSAFPHISALELRDVIIASADRFTSPDNVYGYGIPNFYNAYLKLLTVYNQNPFRFQDGAILYPVPFTDELYVSLYNEKAGERLIELFDLQGRKVFSYSVYLRDETYELLRLDGVQALSSGEYVLRMDGKKKSAQRITKLR